MWRRRMILSDRTLKEIILNKKVFLVNPLNPEDIQPNSIDLHLGETLKRLDGVDIDLTQSSYKLKPNEFLLGSTMERVHVPFDLTARVDGKSSLGRLGIMIHSTAGMIDAGFTGDITLEIKNISDKPFELVHGDTVCQILFETLTTPVDRPYGTDGLGSHYQHSNGTVRSKYEPL